MHNILLNYYSMKNNVKFYAKNWSNIKNLAKMKLQISIGICLFTFTDFDKEIHMKKLLITSLTALVVLTGCNTVKGFGKDVSKTGEAVSNTAEKVENKL